MSSGVVSLVDFQIKRVAKLRKQAFDQDRTVNQLVNDDKIAYSKQAAASLKIKQDELIREHDKLKRLMKFENPNVEVHV